MTEGENLRMTRADFEKAVKHILRAPPASKKAKKPSRRPKSNRQTS